VSKFFSFLKVVPKVFDLLELALGVLEFLYDKYQAYINEKRIDDALKKPDRQQAASDLDDIFRN